MKPANLPHVAAALALLPLLAQAAGVTGLDAADGGLAVESIGRAGAGAKLPGKSKPAPEPVVVPKAQTSLSGLRLSMDSLRFEGQVKVDDAGLRQALAPWLDRDLSLSEFEQATQAIADHLRRNGHPNVRVRMSRANTKDKQMAVLVEGLTPRAEDYADAEPVAPRILIQQLVVQGSTVLGADEADALLAPWRGKALTIPELQQPAEAVAAHLRAKGYPLAQAYLPPQRVDGGKLVIQVQEGVVERVSVQGPGRRLNTALAEAMVAVGAPSGQALNAAELERSLMLLNDLPAVQVKAQLVPGTQPGTTIVQTQVDEGPLVSGSATLDNHGNRHSGEVRLGLNLAINSPTGYGDTWTFQGSASTGARSARLGVQAPVNRWGTRVGAAYASATVNTKLSVIPVTLDGKADAGTLFAQHPLLRSPVNSVYAVASYDHKRMQHNIAGSNFSDRTVDLLTAGLAGDGVRGWGAYQFSATMSLGDADLSANAGNALRDAQTTRTAGHFQKLNASGAAQSPLPSWGPPWSVYAAVTGQWAGQNLDNAEKFQLGGPSGVRAYPVGEGFGDVGALMQLELRRNLGETALGQWSACAFWDIGQITQYRHTWAGWTSTDQDHPNTYNLQGAGVGVSVVKQNTGSVKAILAHKLGHNPNPTITGEDNDGTSRSLRFWLIGTISF